MKKLIGSILLACILPVLLAAASDSERITGYFSDSGYWELGAPIDVLALDGFSFAYEDEDEQEECWEDSLRTLQFDGADKEVRVRLYFEERLLALITIDVPLAEKSFASLKKYYAMRYTKFEYSEAGTDFCEWTDKDGNSLSLGLVDDEDLGTITAVNYSLHRDS